ncbi:MAG: AAA family ATPase, partial [Muribaculaceae bacterium]|nr:AAA family ATPase [Muribaculaceae bacterium]
MGKNKIKYPIGEQSFELLRKEGFLYVDKTEYIGKLIEDGKYFFLGRPRRFGKSLFLSCLKCFFEGKRELFNGLYVDTMDWSWERYPVLYLDLNISQYKENTDLDEVIEYHLRKWEEEYKIDVKDKVISLRFANIIECISKRTGKGVVILVDEYDKPLVNNIHYNEQFEGYRNKLAALYSNFKSSADYIRMVFLTGVSRFGKLSVFSGLNNIRDLSFINEYSAICGITEEELLDNFQEGIAALAEENGRKVQEEIVELKKWYDGYHFSSKSPDIYNPFSILQIFAGKEYSNYWIASGNSSLLAEQLKLTNSNLEEIINTRCTQNTLEGLDISSPRPIALLYQTGYLTIKRYDERRKLFHLGIPNEEVK